MASDVIVTETPVAWQIDQALFSFSVLHSLSLHPSSSSVLGPVLEALLSQNRLEDAMDMLRLLGGVGQSFGNAENASAISELVLAVAEKQGFDSAFELFESIDFSSTEDTGPFATTCANLLIAAAIDAGNKAGAMKVYRSMQSMGIGEDTTTMHMLQALKTLGESSNPNTNEKQGQSQDQSSGGSFVQSAMLAMFALMAAMGGLFAASEAGMQMLQEKSRSHGHNDREKLAAEYLWTEKEIRLQESQLELTRRRLSKLKSQIEADESQLKDMIQQEAEQGAALTEQAAQGPAKGASAFTLMKARHVTTQCPCAILLACSHAILLALVLR